MRFREVNHPALGWPREAVKVKIPAVAAVCLRERESRPDSWKRCFHEAARDRYDPFYYSGSELNAARADASEKLAACSPRRALRSGKDTRIPPSCVARSFAALYWVYTVIRHAKKNISSARYTLDVVKVAHVTASSRLVLRIRTTFVWNIAESREAIVRARYLRRYFPSPRGLVGTTISESYALFLSPSGVKCHQPWRGFISTVCRRS